MLSVRQWCAWSWRMSGGFGWVTSFRQPMPKRISRFSFSQEHISDSVNRYLYVHRCLYIMNWMYCTLALVLLLCLCGVSLLSVLLHKEMWFVTVQLHVYMNKYIYCHNCHMITPSLNFYAFSIPVWRIVQPLECFCKGYFVEKKYFCIYLQNVCFIRYF